MNSASSFWDRYTGKRVTRRRALQMAALTGASAGAIALVGCTSDDDEEPSTSGSPSGAKSPSVSGEGTPRPGGTVRITLPLVTGKDPHPAGSFIPHAFGSYTYSRLMRFKTAVGVIPQEDRYTPVNELVKSYQNPDPLTYIFTLRDDVTFHDVPPVSGRKFVAQDVIDSYKRYTELSPNKGNFLNVVDSITADNDTQVTFKLKAPFGLFLHRLASYQDLWIIPKELTDAKLTEETPVGSGPFVFESFTAGEGAKWNKNPNYFEKDDAGNPLPYVDSIELALIPDSNQVISQFLAGQLHTIFLPAKQKSAIGSNAVIDAAPRNILNFLYFEPASFNANKPPFNDERVRRGMSRALDRESLLELAAPGDGGKFASIPINSGFSDFWWLDPQGDDIGDAGVNFEYDPAEAKLLFEAAGVNEFEVPMHFSSNVYSIVVPYYDVIRQALPAMLSDAGVTVKEVPEEYSGVYIPKTFAGEFDGMALGLESVFSDVAAYYTNMFYPRDAGGGRNHSQIDDAELRDNIAKMLQEQDIEEIRSQGIELQKYLAEKMYYVPGITPIEYTARQKSLKGVVNTEGPTTYAAGTEGGLRLWLDA